MTSIEMINAIIKGDVVEKESTSLSEGSFKQLQYEANRLKRVLGGSVREFTSTVQVRKLIISKQRINRLKLAKGIFKDHKIKLDSLTNVIDYMQTYLEDIDVEGGYLNMPKRFNKNKNLEDTARDVTTFLTMLRMLNALNEQNLDEIASRTFTQNLDKTKTEYQELVDAIYNPQLLPSMNFQILLIISIILHVKNHSENDEYKAKINAMDKNLIFLISQQYYDHTDEYYARNIHSIFSLKNNYV